MLRPGAVVILLIALGPSLRPIDKLRVAPSKVEGRLADARSGQTTPADLVLLDGRVLTVDDKFSVASALAIRDGRFIAVGSNDAVRVHIGSMTRVIDGRGRTVIPGLIDTHVHALGVAEEEATQPFRNLRSIAELQAWIRSESQTTATGDMDLDAARVSDPAARASVPDARGTGRRVAAASSRR